jgi:hypothetical protein
MNTYQTLQQKMVGLAFIVGPLLTILGSVAYMLGIGLSPLGPYSWVDGIFMTYGFLLMIPIALELSRILGQRAPIFGLICAILGLGWGMSIIPAAARTIQAGMFNAGLNELIFTVFDAMPGVLFFMLPSLLSIVGFLLLGVGLLWKGGIPRWAAGLIIVGSVFFFAGVSSGTELTEKILTILAHVSFLIALAPIGLRYFAGDSQVYELEMATTSSLTQPGTSS